MRIMGKMLYSLEHGHLFSLGNAAKSFFPPQIVFQEKNVIEQLYLSYFWETDFGTYVPKMNKFQWSEMV